MSLKNVTVPLMTPRRAGSESTPDSSLVCINGRGAAAVGRSRWRTGSGGGVTSPLYEGYLWSALQPSGVAVLVDEFTSVGVFVRSGKQQYLGEYCLSLNIPPNVAM